jgi:hypothetical protein
MAAVLSASVAFLKMGLSVKGSSHLAGYDPEAAYKKAPWNRKKAKDDTREHFKLIFPKNTTLKAWGGLTLAPDEFERDKHDNMANLYKLREKSSRRIEQVEDLAAVIRKNNCKISLQISGSNDFKYFVVKNGSLVQLKGGSSEIWEKREVKLKSKCNPKRARFFGKESALFMKGQVEKYVAILVKLYENSSYEYVFHSSILERSYPKFKNLENLEIYFAYVNYYLDAELKKLNTGKGVLNKAGRKISWNFVDVSNQYYEAASLGKIGSLFRPKEVIKGEMVHRSMDSMDKLVHTYLMSIHGVLGKEGVL